MKISPLSLLCLAILSWRAVSSSDHGKISPTFDTDPLYHHRAYHAIVVRDNYLYIDGGEITTWNGVGDKLQTETVQNGTKEGDIITLPCNWTYSIDLTTSWTNRSVNLNPIPKDPAPQLNREALWLLDNNIYQYDGGHSEATSNWGYDAPRTNQFWEFHAAGDSGHWTQQAVITPPSRPPLIEIYQGYYASGNNLGFAIGGVEDDSSYYEYSDEDLYAWRRVPGIVMYNQSSQEWFNASTKDFAELSIQGAAQFVPNFGPEGILFALGGMYNQEPSGEPDHPIPLDTAYMFEPVSKQWHKQQVTGDYPETTTNQCVVGLEGDDGTYEIFMYGGHDPDRSIETTMNLGAVFVLSLPSFHWEKQPDPLRYGRWSHLCEIAGPNDRQMISVGGIVITGDVDDDSFSGGTVDPWDQGIGVFDMSDLEWKSSFSPSTDPYTTPSLIKDYLKSHDRYPSWDDDVVEQWFVEQARFTRSNYTPSSPQTTSTGAIAGGVVGGVVGLAIICALIIFFMIRRKRRNREGVLSQGTESRKNVDMKEMDGSGHRAELSGKWYGAEHAGSPIHELDGGRRA